MRAVLVDPVERRVREVDTDGSLASLQSLVGGYIEAVTVDRLHPDLRGHHGYLDEEGRLKPEVAGQKWTLKGWPEAYLCGPCVILRSTDYGDEDDATVSLETVAGLVDFADSGAHFPPMPRPQVRGYDTLDELFAALGMR